MTTSTWVPIRDKVEDFFSLAMDFILPTAAIAVQFFNLPLAVAAVLRGLPALMAIMEEASPEPGTGAAKKAAVMKAAKDLMGFAGSKFTGPALENFNEYAPLISKTIDSTISIINKMAPTAVADDSPEVPGSVGS